MINRAFKIVFLLVALLIACTSLWVSNALISDLKKQEQQRVEIWATAMRSFTEADETTDLNLVWHVLNDNNTIPVVALYESGEVAAARNMSIPQDSIEIALSDPTTPAHRQTLEALKARAEYMKANGNYIVTPLSDNANMFVYYESSLLLRRLTWFPYIQLAVVALLLLLAFAVLLAAKRSEQNKVWVGLSRETAHQLGTPLSSLVAGAAILSDEYPEDPLIPEIDKDIQRLQLIADRFSKIGSVPILEAQSLQDVLRRVVSYVGKRAGKHIEFIEAFPEQDVIAEVNAPLFEWVIENLCKNAIDAMEGSGTLTLRIAETSRHIVAEVSDTGKGIPKNKWKRVFKPGYTTKTRGWGLGLSLARRIIEEYHRGKIFVKSSSAEGTTFCILLNKTSAI
ncbi:MAG: HAMP domain-containing histidine kinase [Alloprevotella sp.]|nr:HAMP domain-containing histidine kinase [Alloprevotella sp.]